ncbi:cache domain-containing protein, partial [Falsiroseomonas oryzae]|uniref:cache domain-containing protein n=1 Tax=Falsiroseomonas oryzae TaxID=2766473 RepID=UPI0022EB5103
MASRGAAWRRLRLALVCFALLASALFAAAMLADREATLQGARANAENSAALLAEQADRMLRVAELTAARTADLVQRLGIAAVTDAERGQLDALDSTAPEVSSIWIIDGNGRLVANTYDPQAARIDLSDRDYFRALAAGGSEYLTGLAEGRATGIWFFGWARAIRGEAGFEGVAYAALHADEFARLVQRLQLGPGAEVELMRHDGTPLMNWPRPGAVARVPSAPRDGAAGLTEETGADGMRRLVAWRAAPTMPVTAVVLQSRAHVLAPFERRLLRNGLVFVLSLALAGALGGAAVRAGQREAEAMR